MSFEAAEAHPVLGTSAGRLRGIVRTGQSRSLFEPCWPTERASQKISNQPRDLVWLLVERKVASIEDVDFRPGQIALIGGRLGSLE